VTAGKHSPGEALSERGTGEPVAADYGPVPVPDGISARPAPATAADAAAPAPAVRTGALRNPVMRTIVVSESVSAFGSQMSYLALPWFVLATTGSVTRMGLVFAIELLPVALLGLPSGLLVQRWGVRRTLITGDTLRGPLIALVPILHLAGLLRFPVLLAVVFLVGACGAPYLSAQRLVLPETFGDDEALVVAGNGMLEGATRLASLAGPAAGGALIAVLGAVNVLWIDAASFAFSAVLLAMGLPRPAQSLAAAAPDAGRGVFQGARFVLGNQLLSRVSAAALLFGFFFPLLLASLPVLTERRYGGHAQVAGLLFAAWGGGALLGTTLLTAVSRRMPPITMGAVAAVCMAIPLWLLPFVTPAWAVGTVLVVSGIFTPMLNAPLITLILLRTPPELRAQVITFVMTANLLAGPLGYALAGPLLGWTSIRAVLLLVSSGVSVAALVLLTLLGADREERSEAEAAAG
jgi:predicted MFS family arabinose efflux permease